MMAEQIDEGGIQATAKGKMLRELIKQMVKLMKGGAADTEIPVADALAEVQKEPEGDMPVSQETKETCECGKSECDGSCKGDGDETFASFLNKKPVTQKPVAAKMVFASIAKKPQPSAQNQKWGKRG
jgi:hypothetical protein